MNDLMQGGGRIAVTGALAVSRQFEQTAGQLRAGGAATIAQRSGDMSVRHLVAQGVTLQALDGGLMLGNFTASGNLSLNAATGRILQAEGTTLTVGGTTIAAAPAGSIYLMAAGNRFSGAVSASGADIGITQGAQALTLGNVSALSNLAVSAGGNVSQTGALTVAGKTSVDAGPAAITLDNAANDFMGSVELRSGALNLVDGVGGLVLANVQTTGATRVDSLAGPLTQTGGFFTIVTTPVPVFNAWLNGNYSLVNLVTQSLVSINGELLNAEPLLRLGVASVLGLSSAGVSSADGEGNIDTRRFGRAFKVPSTVPVASPPNH